MKQVQVLIAGGGPVGMTLACELAQRGVTCMLVERKQGAEPGKIDRDLPWLLRTPLTLWVREAKKRHAMQLLTKI